MENDKNRILLAKLVFALVASAVDGFQTLLGNIQCAIPGDELRCDIVKHS